jgi:hypothetical protein
MKVMVSVELAVGTAGAQIQNASLTCQRYLVDVHFRD